MAAQIGSWTILISYCSEPSWVFSCRYSLLTNKADSIRLSDYQTLYILIQVFLGWPKRVSSHLLWWRNYERQFVCNCSFLALEILGSATFHPNTLIRFQELTSWRLTSHTQKRVFRLFWWKHIFTTSGENSKNLSHVFQCPYFLGKFIAHCKVKISRKGRSHSAMLCISANVSWTMMYLLPVVGEASARNLGSEFHDCRRPSCYRCWRNHWVMGQSSTCMG